MLEKQIPKQVGGVAAALVGTRGPLRDEHKPLLHGPFPADTQGDHSPNPKLPAPHAPRVHRVHRGRHWAQDPSLTLSSLSVKVSLCTVC